MNYWAHPHQPALPKKKPIPSVPQIKALLLEYHGMIAEAIANLTIDEEEYIHGYAKEEDEWYSFIIYEY